VYRTLQGSKGLTGLTDCSRLAFVLAGRFPLMLGQELLNESSQTVNFGLPGIDRIFIS
jgi:hypothetical protein